MGDYFLFGALITTTLHFIFRHIYWQAHCHWSENDHHGLFLLIDPMIIICLLFAVVVFSSITLIAETHFQLTLCAASAHIIMLFTNRACWILTWLACQPLVLPCSISTAGGATGMCVFTQSSARMGILLNGLSNYWITLVCVPVVLQGESLYTNLSRLLH